MEKPIIAVISGPAGVGKGMVNGTVLSKYPEKFAFSVSATTRNPRPGEVEGVSYFYITDDDFKAKIKNSEFLEYNTYVKHSYGTLKSYADEKLAEGKNVILEIDTNGARQVREKLGDDCVLIFIAPPSFEMLEKRLRGRGTETEEAIIGRLSEAKKEFSRMDMYDYIVINEEGKIEEAAEQVVNCIEAYKHSVKRMTYKPEIKNLMNK